MITAMGPFRVSQAPSWLSDSRTDVPAYPFSHRPCPLPACFPTDHDKMGYNC